MSLYAQSDFFKNYNGIPITTNLWGKEAWMYDRYNFKDIDSAGIDAVVVTNTNSSLYENFRKASTKFKLIPYMHMKNTNRTGICFFSEKAYTVFEAEGNPDLAINLVNSGGVEYYEGGINGITNNTNQNMSCNIIQGPEHYCNLAKSIINDLPLDLRAKFYIKVNWRNVNNHPPSIQNYLNLNICKLSITAKKDSAPYDTTFAEITLKVSDLLPLNDYKQIILPYFTSSKGAPENILQQQIRLTYATQGELYWVIPNVKYHVYWYEIPDLSLYVDKIILQDPNGNDLINSIDLSSYSLPAEINFSLEEPDPFNANEVVGWYPVDEPYLIDMQSCLAKLDTLINIATPQLHLMPGVACSWDGNLFGSGSPSKILEYSKRGKYNGSIMHKYLYHDPYTPLDGQEYYLQNIICYIANLKNYQEADPNFICSIQSGIWSNDSLHIKRKIHPSPEQFLYNTNLALLYGAKGIDVNDYYYYINDENVENRTGMVGIYGSYSGSYDLVPTSIWYTLRDTISPRLKGNYGRLLKKLQQHTQGQLLNQSSLTVDNVQFSRNGETSIDDARDYDCGTFVMPESSGDKKYFMIVSRYYQGLFTETSPTSINFICSNLSEKKYTVNEHYYDTKSYYYATNNAITFNKSLRLGSALLFEVMPAIKYGGCIIGNETISSSQSLLEHLTINSNQQLTISGSNTVYSLTDTVTIQNNASINCTLGGKINSQAGYIQFVGTGRIIFDNWYNSLFYTSENGHPKLIWGYQAGTKTYHVYKYTGGTWVNIANISTTAKDITHRQYYVDTDEEIYSGANSIRYKVIEGNSNETNEVSIHVLPKEFIELSEQFADFQVEQNYPNPFNPTTTIAYQIPSTGRVSIKLYDMLGREVKDIFKGIQAMGSYNIEVNCTNLASGVYIYRIQYNDKVLSKKMILQK